MPTISAKESIYKLIRKHPNLSDVLYRHGFTDIVKPQMLHTVGLFMTLQKGCEIRTIDIYELQSWLQEDDFTLINVDA